MLFNVIALSALVAGVVAQSGLDPCILGCSVQALSSSPCTALTDFACVCTSAAFQNAAAACLVAKCTAADQANAVAISKQECAGYAAPTTTTTTTQPPQTTTTQANTTPPATTTTTTNSPAGTGDSSSSTTSSGTSSAASSSSSSSAAGGVPVSGSLPVSGASSKPSSVSGSRTASVPMLNPTTSPTSGASKLAGAGLGAFAAILGAVVAL